MKRDLELHEYSETQLCITTHETYYIDKLGAIHKLRHTNFMIFFYPSPLVTGGHISETPHIV